MTEKIDLLYIFGGGRNKDGSLTELSKQRLDFAGFFKNMTVGGKILVPGGRRSTFRKNAIEFKETGANQKFNYLVKNWKINRRNIYKYPYGGDTILEAFALAMALKEVIPPRVSGSIRTIGIVTSTEHLKRAGLCTLMALQRLFPKRNFEVIALDAPSNDLVDKNQEDELFKHTLKFWRALDKNDLPNKDDWYGWYEKYNKFYDKQEKIIQKYRSLGRGSMQAYAGVK